MDSEGPPIVRGFSKIRITDNAGALNAKWSIISGFTTDY
jgi:hypothetical protein